MSNKTMKTTAAAQINLEELAKNQLASTDRDTIMNAIATIQATMPYLIDLTLEQRKALPKMGDSSVAFVRKALELAKQNPDFLPRSFQIEQMQQSLEFWEQMNSIMLAFNQLQELMDDTYVAVGSKVFSEALTIYHYAKAVEHTGVLENSVVELGKRFAHKRRKREMPKAIEN
jgi:hypothetical protein